MKSIIIFATTVALLLASQIVNGQEADVNPVQTKLEEQKEEIVNSEKRKLKEKVEEINERLIKQEITQEEAQRLKEEAAKLHALNIENRISILENKIELAERNGLENLNIDDPRIWIALGGKDPDSAELLFGVKVNTNTEKKVKYDIRTSLGLVIAMGLNNVVVKGESLEDSEYKIAGSRFFELGVVSSTRVFKNTNFLRFKYGLSYMSNGLKPTGNRYFIENGDQTELEDFDIELDKSKFRVDHLVVPAHFEFGPSKVKKSEEKIRYYSEKKFKVGVGGYAGLRISTRQKLKYSVDGDKVKDKIKRSYNTSDFTYGASAYAGFGAALLYLKYDLSPVFQNAIVEQNNVSLGVRFDL